jgi:hypothetical protein
MSSMMEHVDDFYMVLPSNSSPITRPNNMASDYTVTWDQEIELDPKFNWQVAMTEISYNYSNQCIIGNLGLKYRKPVQRRSPTDNWFFGIYYVKYPESVEIEFYDITQYTVGIECYIENNILVIQSKFPFYAIFESVSARDNAGYRNRLEFESKYENGKWLIRGSEPFIENFHNMPKNKNLIAEIHLVCKEIYYQETQIDFNPPQPIQNIAELVQYISHTFPHIFEEFKLIGLGSDMRVVFKSKPDIQEISFANSLCMVLGLDRATYSKNYESNPAISAYDTNKIINVKGLFKPNLKNACLTMYVYSSICQPIRVGHTLAPLIKHIPVFISKENHFVETRNYEIKHPMYLPVALTSFNSIEINIRSDSGRLIQFNKDAVTIITLHFKKS